MKILSFKPGHDGSIAGVDGNEQRLKFSYEAEKGSFPRNSSLNPDTFIQAGLWFNQLPDVIALSGWSTIGADHVTSSGAGYLGIDKGSERVAKKTFFGKTLEYYSSTHERSHIWAAYSMSPFEQGEPCYALVWEGVLGDFYEIDQNLNIQHIGRVMANPGKKYSFFNALADPKFTQSNGVFEKEDPGRLMAAGAFGDPSAADGDADTLIDSVLNADTTRMNLSKADYASSPYHNIGTEDERFRHLAAKLSDTIFRTFHDFAETNLKEGYPLLISGGCGLNCDWNTRWKNSPLFRDVFIPPCTSDSGSAIGTAVDAMRHFTGRAKLDWTVYSGQAFIDDRVDMEDVEVSELNLRGLASALNDGLVIGWASGECEIGPRALGNRSILASPFNVETRKRLNKAKGRTETAPVAPVCLEEDVSKHFDWSGPSPYMLHFQQVTDPRLKAVTHIDGSARVQTVTREQNAMLYDLLKEFKAISGVGVLCNTSLNFKHAGFINKTSDLYHYARSVGLDGFVAGISLYRFK